MQKVPENSIVWILKHLIWTQKNEFLISLYKIIWHNWSCKIWSMYNIIANYVQWKYEQNFTLCILNSVCRTQNVQV